MNGLAPIVSWPVMLAAARERIKTPLLIGLVLVMLIIALGAAGPNADGSEGFAAIAGFLLLIFTMMLGAGLIDEEFAAGHAQLVLLRPLTRAQWFGGRLAGAGSVLAAAMTLVWLSTTANAVSKGAHFDLARVLALPVAFVWAFAWLAVLAALSVVLKAWTNIAWLLFATILWWASKLAINGINAVMVAKDKSTDHFSQTVVGFIGTIEPYVCPQDPLQIIHTLHNGGRPDWSPLAYDLVWLFGAWTVGCVLLNRRELSRRTT
ncbi:MAG: ABC transporter permease [Deltaproteobacteria bacterium]|nr:ABC transporter permease [Deltaproteobacteria bacterium]